jgi:hypothetical protein
MHHFNSRSNFALGSSSSSGNGSELGGDVSSGGLSVEELMENKEKRSAEECLQTKQPKRVFFTFSSTRKQTNARG